MTSAENVADAGTIAGGANVGVNLSGGTVTVSGVKTAAALFVQADTTLDFSDPDARLNISGPLYVADGATLTINVGTTATGYRESLITCGERFASNSQIVFASETGYVDIPVLGDTSIGVVRIIEPSGTPAAIDYTKWSSSVNSVWTWKETGNAQFHAATFQQFDLQNETDTGDEYNGEATGAPVSGEETRQASYSVDGKFWYYFAHSHNTYNKIKGYYSAPGRAIRLVSGAGITYTSNLNAAFEPLTFGGMIVPTGASGYSLVSDGTRSTILGDPVNNGETWFEFQESLTFNREGKFCLAGTVNIGIEEGKFLDFNSARANDSCQPQIVSSVSNDSNAYATTAGGCLKMHGEGMLLARKLTATGACLDYSDLSLTRTFPFIGATLAVDVATTYKFPELSGAASYRLASSLSADAKYTTSFSIGGNEYTGPLTFTAASGTVTFPAVATLAEGNLENYLTWADIDWEVGPATIDSTTDVIINVTDDTALDTSAAALSLGSLAFNIAPGKTLRLVTTATTTVADVLTVTGGGTLEIATSGATIAGDVTVAGDATIAGGTQATPMILTVNGNLSVASGATLTLAPVTISGTSAAILTATALDVSGSLAVSAPDSANIYELDTTTAANTITLKRTPAPAKICNASVAGWNAGQWGTFGGGTTFGNVRVGPSADFAMVAEVTSDFNPHVGFQTPAATGWSFSVYADVSKTSDSTSSRPILACFGTINSDNTLLLYREGSAVKLGWYKSGAFVAGWAASVSEVSAGFHLYSFTCDPTTGKVTLYVDGGSASSNDSEYLFGAMDLPAGFQLGKAYGGAVDGFATATGMAVAAFMYYDSELNAAEVAALAAKYPATNGSVIPADIDNRISNSAIRGSAITVYSSTAAGNQYLGVSGAATLNIPDGETVNVPHMRVQNTTSAGATTVNIRGTVNVTSVSDDPNLAWKSSGTPDYLNYKGVLLGNAATTGTGAFNVYGTLDASGTWLQTVSGATGAQTLTVDGGTLKTKGFYSDKADKSTIVLQNGGTIEIASTTDRGQNIAYRLGNGTYRQKATGTVKGTVAFTGTAAAPTTLDPYGCEMTVPTASSEGYVTVADSSTAGNGKVYFTGSGGCVILTDENAALIDISNYSGKVLLRGTSAATLAKLGGFAGVVKIDTAYESAYDFREVNLSGATVELNAAGATFIATAGQEGSVTAIAGAVQLYASNQIFLYDGHVFTGGINTFADAASLTYIHSEAAPEDSQSLSYAVGQEIELAEVLADNNLVPYYRIFTGDSETGVTGTLSTPAHWRNLPDNNVPTSGNVAIRVEDGKTLVVNVDNTTAFREVQIYGTGNVVLQLQGSGAMTVSGGIYLASTVTLEIQGGVAFDAGAGIHVQAGSTATVNCGTSETPFVVPYVGGYGTVAITADANATVSGGSSLGAMTVAGTVAFSGAVRITNLSIADGATANVNAAITATTFSVADGGTANVNAAITATTFSVASGATANVANAVTLTAPTLAVDGELNMLGATSTLSGVTSLSGTGAVSWNGKAPDMSIWNTSSGWRGTNIVANTATSGDGLTGMNPKNWGRNGSYIVFKGVRGYFAKVADTVQAECIFENGATAGVNDGYSLFISNGYSDTYVAFRKISGSGTIQAGSNNATTPLYFRDASGFNGSIEMDGAGGKKLIYSPSLTAYNGNDNDNSQAAAGQIYVAADGRAVIGNGNSWQAHSTNGARILGTVVLEGSGTINCPVKIGGATAKIVLADSPLALSSTLIIENGAALEIDPGEIAIADATPVALVTGLTAEPDLTNVTVVDAALTAVQDAETEKWSICATLADGVWNTGSGNWTASSFNGTSQTTDAVNVKFRESADGSTAATIALDAARAPANVTFKGGDTAYTLTGGAFEPTGTVTVESGSVTIESPATGTYVVNAGATLVLKEVANATISGDGTIIVPQGTTCVFDGVTCSAKVVVEGTLQTKGTTNLSGANTSAAGSLIEVVSGATTLASEYRGIFGDITIGSAENGSAQLTMGASYQNGTDLQWDWLGTTSATCFDVYGTLTLGDRNLILYVGNSIKLREGATIVGDASGTAAFYGNLAFVGNAAVQVYGNATINAHINSRTGTSPVFTVEENATLTVSQTFTGQTSSESSVAYFCGGSLTKAGAGTLDLTAITMSKPLTINAGTVVSSAVPTGAVTINENGQFTLKNCAWTGSGNVFQGTGTLELYPLGGDRTHNATGSTFGGILKLSNAVSGNTTYQNNINPTSADMFDASVRPELVANSSSTHLGDGYYNNLSHPLRVRNLSGTGQLRAQWTSGTFNYVIDTVQERNTVFSGTLGCDVYTGNRYINFNVHGDDSGDVHSLTITTALNGNNDNGCKASTLTVSDNAKVVFSGNGSWGYGAVVVGDGGYLEVQNTASKHAETLILNDGATLVFADGCPLNVGASLTLPSGEGEAVSIAFGANVDTTDLAGVKLISWSAAPEGDFEFADSSLASEYKLVKTAAGLEIAHPYAATVTDSVTGAVTMFATLQDAVNDAAGSSTKYITAYADGSATTSLSSVMIVANGFNVAIGSTKAGYELYEAIDMSAQIAGLWVWRERQCAATFVWNTEVASGVWGSTANWTSADGTVARVPGALDTVKFNSAATVQFNAPQSFGSLEVNAAVVFSRGSTAAEQGTYPSLNAGGAITTTGGGSLTLSDVNLANASGASLSIGVPVTVSGQTTLTVAEGVTGTFVGSGTLTLTALTDGKIVGDAWKGTVVLPAITSGLVNFNNFGNSGSTVRVTSMTGGYLPDAVIEPALEIPSGSTMTLTAFSPSYANTLSKLKGSGTLAINVAAGDANGNDLANIANWSSGKTHYSAYLRISDVSEFTGSLTANTAPGIAIGSSKPHYQTLGGTILVNSDASATVASGATWTAGTIKVDGNLTVASGATLSGSIAGAGNIVLAALPNSAFTFESWTGTVAVPAITTGPAYLNYYGVVGSTLEIPGFSSWLKNDDGQRAVHPDLKLTGAYTAATSAQAYSYQGISGSGDMTFTGNATSIAIAKVLADYAGTIANNASGKLTVSRVVLSGAPAAGQKVLSTTTPNNVDVTAVYVGDAQQANLILAKREDGIYVAAASEAVTVGGESVTSLATASWATELDATGISGKVAIPGTVTQITGVTAANLLLKAMYTPEGGSETTAYYPGILALDASGNVSLNSAASVTVGSETVSVAPALDTTAASPMAVAAGAVPSFAVKTVPGLKYKVVAATGVGEGGALAGTETGGASVQATSTSTTVAAPAFPAGANVLYYKIGAEL